MSKDRINISHGPQFHGFVSTLGMFGAIGCVIATIYYLLHLDLISEILSYLGFMVSLGIFLDIRGVIIDFRERRIMEYRNFLGVKNGNWESLKNFDKIVLTYESVATVNAISRFTQSRRAKSNYSFCLVLKNTSSASEIKNFEIGEYGSHRTGRVNLLKLSKRLDYPYEDEYFVLSKKAQKRRKQIEKRRVWKSRR